MWKFTYFYLEIESSFYPGESSSGDGAFFCTVLHMGSLGCAGIAVLELPWAQSGVRKEALPLAPWFWVCGAGRLKVSFLCPFAETMPLTAESCSHSSLPLALFSLNFCDVVSLFSLYPKSGSCYHPYLQLPVTIWHGLNYFYTGTQNSRSLKRKEGSSDATQEEAAQGFGYRTVQWTL